MKPLLVYATLMIMVSCAPAPLTDSVAPANGWRARLTPEERAETQTAYLRKRLRLSAGQVEAMQVITLHYARQIQALRDRHMSREVAHQQLLDLLTRRDAELTPLLTDEQRTRFTSLRAVQLKRLNKRYQQTIKVDQP